MSATDLVVLAGSAEDAPKPQSMGLRMAENFMQRWFLLLIPVVALTATGVWLAQRQPVEYLGTATLSTSANPLVEEQEVRGLSGRSQDSAAAATARVINERLGTERFAAGVAARAGLADAIDDGRLSLGDIEARVRLIPVGESLVDIEARWSDPETTLGLINATLDEYTSVLQSTVSRDAQSAVDFYETRRADAMRDAERATQELNDFVAGLGEQLDGDVLALADNLEVERLNDRVRTAQAAIDAADASIEDARLSVVRAQSEAGASIEVIDPAASSFEPQSSFADKALLVAAFVLLGLLAAGALLAFSTLLDRSVRSAADIEAAGGGTTVAAVPVIESLRQPGGAARALRSAGRAPTRLFGRRHRTV